MRSVETVVIGAGISGLTTAAALGKNHDVLVLERDSDIGGYCKTVVRDGFVWDYSGHFFHFKHPDIEQWLKARMPGQKILTVEKQSAISYAGRHIDFPFQKNIHQLPQAEFIDCLYDLYFAKEQAGARGEANFKDMLYARLGRSIAEKFLIPYNEKLYATDLATLDRDAMGRFFPHAEVSDIIRNMRQQNNASYNSHFTYPEGGAIQYVNAIASEVNPQAIARSESVEHIDVDAHVVRTNQGSYRYQRLISSAPFTSLMKAARVEFDAAAFTWNQVLVFNLGFDRKGPKNLHWLYVPNRERVFYRVGFYDNIFDTPRMSLYVEVGFARDAKIDVEATRRRVLDDLRAEGLVTDHQLVAEHHVVMNPAYVHITSQAQQTFKEKAAWLAARDVHTIGRYGGWTYCSIEDNIVEARTLVTKLGLARGWPLAGV